MKKLIKPNDNKKVMPVLFGVKSSSPAAGVKVSSKVQKTIDKGIKDAYKAKEYDRNYGKYSSVSCYVMQ